MLILYFISHRRPLAVINKVCLVYINLTFYYSLCVCVCVCFFLPVTVVLYYFFFFFYVKTQVLKNTIESFCSTCTVLTYFKIRGELDWKHCFLRKTRFIKPPGNNPSVAPDVLYNGSLPMQWMCAIMPRLCSFWKGLCRGGPG